MQKKCQLKEGENNCAHQLSKALRNLYPILMAGDGKHFCNSNGFMRCGCGAAVRAREVAQWAANNGTKVNKWDNDGIFVIFEHNNVEAGGHVWGIVQGTKCGNGYYNAYPSHLKNQTIYRL